MIHDLDIVGVYIREGAVANSFPVWVIHGYGRDDILTVTYAYKEPFSLARTKAVMIVKSSCISPS